MCSTAGEMLVVAQPFLVDHVHPTVIIAAFRQALDDMLEIVKNQIRLDLMWLSKCY